MEKRRKIKRNISEKRLVDVLRNYLARMHYVEREIAHYKKRIDIVAVCSNSGELWGIEAKTKNWKRAIEQAVVNLTAVERSYIAVYADFVHRVQLEELYDYGIGLISVGSKWGDVRIIRESDTSPFINRLMNQRIKTELDLRRTNVY